MKIVVIILVLLVVGLYFYTEQTKGTISITGNAAKEIYEESKPLIKDTAVNITNSWKNKIN